MQDFNSNCRRCERDRQEKAETDFDKWMLTKPKKGEENTVVQKKGPNGQVKGWNWCDKHEKMVLAIGRDGRPHSLDTCTH